MKNWIAKSVIGLLCVSGLASVAQASTVSEVDTSMTGIFNAVLESRNLQKTMDTLTANGVKPDVVVSVAAAAGIPFDTLKEVAACTNNMSPEKGPLGLTCMKATSLTVAYETGMNDRLSYLPSTAAGPAKKKTK